MTGINQPYSVLQECKRWIKRKIHIQFSRVKYLISITYDILVVPVKGLEPLTPSLRMTCSTS
jgi:hypothetical protein